MTYLLHPPRSYVVFATNHGTISHFLRHKHRWARFYTELTTLPDYISTSCIRELNDGTVGIEAEALDGEQMAEEIKQMAEEIKQMAEEIKGLLMRDGDVEPDLRFAGRLVHRSQGSESKTK
ncbi:hypothetical protein A1F94_011462 [Pyrenophora tritici-repentis]|nr:hypothetical protein A1F94_011462 [Pyrenophora tritici-repentis]KAI0572395.1 hypothetical protein Alg130_10510 [Pyrenophora tritici-repentis]KAI0610685.1 hypothetical protein TUN205_05069 [Pyrenophora tritici-repentis]KAI0622743.1 hypothetical protein TUN199_05260 [Pyrenophora tritici-repentis]